MRCGTRSSPPSGPLTSGHTPRDQCRAFFLPVNKQSTPGNALSRTCETLGAISLMRVTAPGALFASHNAALGPAPRINDETLTARKLGLKALHRWSALSRAAESQSSL